MSSMFAKAESLLRAMLGDQANFRPGQWEAIESIVSKKQPVLVVQRTGWGKSLVYFLATKLLRDQGSGPTLASYCIPFYVNHPHYFQGSI
jgi:ATP-dependent DNA helicase RecQ